MVFPQVTYDLHQVDVAQRFGLRDTLVTALERFATGPKTIITQICLAIAGLALQLPTWENPVQDLIDSFGQKPATVPALLQFLSLLPEELNSNTRIPITVRLALSLFDIVTTNTGYRMTTTELEKLSS